jgi:hypothetical protein
MNKLVSTSQEMAERLETDPDMRAMYSAYEMAKRV